MLLGVGSFGLKADLDEPADGFRARRAAQLSGTPRVEAAGM
jgi:hypothetical protein